MFMDQDINAFSILFIYLSIYPLSSLYFYICINILKQIYSYYVEKQSKRGCG